MYSDLALKLRLLSVFALSCIVVAVGLENTLGVDFTTILGTIGMTSLLTYFVRSNLEMGTPKFVGARKSLNVGLALLSVGTVVVSIAAIENILSSSGQAGIPLETVGTGIFVSGALGMMLALILTDRSREKTLVRMKLPWRIYFAANGLLLASVGGVAFIAVINTWRLYSLSAPLTIVLGFVTAIIFVAGIAFLIIAIRGKTRKRRLAKAPAPQEMPALPGPLTVPIASNQRKRSFVPKN